ncbi:MAG: UDP-N-acetylmuramoyl-tripeptide--D-alanyl-D-alanine ligase [Gammaproteobacteria bacterium]|nr:UDP-N-acetylmuramoyl-tripeptide--D-alanyl-D-alanine ligase [Gammaproteobacteria bacterium]MBT5824918.1 UDP-N-acetylmuramoyl-tripeptide--D-alanyl-D-alanine ligase [Gammaproteobacteria bacterium]MBT6419093.1 UDP-N-acetylmuramoyl-tripeptide--D-alanyl-D-alanine ligase [Gammaproteobacteria bacterium]MBT6575913.1 UDP-N-acetylmuramoyl-tripeptide--D-alanyl-D-alanine ligase [Gammaproteobacteria bacterium]MBT7436513.1 UDP-N-acetylmuramoyl-tripeptide--D-alanyl-D-alanine ligase [Gammaproteobacteria bact
MTLTLNEISEILKAELVGTSVPISGLSIDTRTLSRGDIYLAIKGEQFDGHDFIAQAQQQGAGALIVSKKGDTDLPQLVVKDTRIALAELAGAIRNKLQLKVCAITGSNGKTTVKEMIATILAVNSQVLFTQGNFNNDIGVPLTLLRLKQQQYAVIEMGANHRGEIAYTSHYARPDVAVITNVGPAHIEGFGSIEGVANAKAEIIQSLDEDGIAILNADDHFYGLWKGLAEERKVLSFGLKQAADISAENIITQVQDQQFKTCFDLVADGNKVPVELVLAGEHNVKNALAASAACLALGIDLKQIQTGLKRVKVVNGRLQLFASDSGIKLINDTYNANPASLAVALEVLKQYPGEKWLALGAFGELGADSERIHSEMGRDIKNAGVQRLFATGAMAENTVQAFGVGAEYFAAQDDLIKSVKEQITPEQTLLVKGSRAQKMEVVVNALLNVTGN